MDRPPLVEKIQAIMNDLRAHADEPLPDELEFAEFAPDALVVEVIEAPEPEDEEAAEETMTEEELTAEAERATE